MNRLSLIGISILMLLIASGCNKEDVTNKINHHLEATVQIETDFEEQQEQIFELEKEDQKLYEEIITLGTEEYDKVVSLSDKAIALLEERKEYMDLEKNSMDESKKEFEEIAPLIDKIDEQKQKKRTKKLYDLMMERYNLYDDVYTTYMDSIQSTKDLYTYFKKESYKEKVLYERIDKVNNSYDLVTETYNAFNEKTNQFNELKEDYYKMLEEES